VKFFLDANISDRLARILEIFDVENQIRALSDEFAPNTPDVEWLGTLARESEKSAVLCGDGRILRNRAEAQVLRESGLTMFVLAPGWMNLRWEDQAWKMLKTWPRIVDNALKVRRPSIFRVPVSGDKVEFLFFTAELPKR